MSASKNDLFLTFDDLEYVSGIKRKTKDFKIYQKRDFGYLGINGRIRNITFGINLAQNWHKPAINMPKPATLSNIMFPS